MKASKITLIIQAVAMYLMHLPLIILAVMLLMPNNHQLIVQFAGPFIITSSALISLAQLSSTTVQTKDNYSI